MKKIIFYFWIFIAFTALLHAEAGFNASVDRSTVSAGEKLRVTYKLNAEGGDFRGPSSFPGFEVLMGPSRSQSYQFVNGRSSINLSFSYVLRAKGEGTYTIPPATIKSDGKKLTSNSVEVKVMPKTEAQKAKEKEKRERERTLQEQAQKVLKDNIFITLDISKSSVYEGEQIIATYEMWVNPRLNINNISVNSYPSFNGFYSREIELGENRVQNKVKDGKRFRTQILKKVILYPQKSGKLTLDPYIFDFNVMLEVSGQRRSRDPFDSFFNRGNYKEFKYQAKSETATVNIKPLPQPEPGSFTGAVGSFKPQVWLDRTKTKTGEPVTVKVKLEGNGNFNLMDTPNVDFPPEFEVFDTKKNENLQTTVAGIKGNLLFEYLAIPKNTGDFEIGPVEFSWFDIKSEEYKTFSSEIFNLQVEKGDESQQGVVGTVDKTDVELIGKDIRYIKRDVDLTKDTGSFFGSPVFYVLNILPVLLFAVFVVFRKKQQELESNTALLKNKKASKVAKKRLAEAKKFMEQEDKDKFYEELSKALWGYASDKLSIPFSELSKDKAREKLTGINLDQEVSDKFLEVLDHCEFARYAPSAGDVDIKNTYEDASHVIISMEGKLK